MKDFNRIKELEENKIELYYDPGKPKNFIVDTSAGRWLPYLLIGCRLVLIIPYYSLRKYDTN